MSLKVPLSEEFLTQLNSKWWEHILEMFLRSQKERPANCPALEFYNRWKECYELSPVVMDSLIDEVAENTTLQKIIDRHVLMSEGKKNFLRSAKHRQQFLAFALAIYYKAWKTDKATESLYKEYLAVVAPEMRIKALQNQVKQEQAISAQLRVENAQLRAQLTKVSVRNGMLEKREPVIVHNTVIRRKALKRKQPE